MTFAAPQIDAGATAWLLACTVLALVITPGLAFFYGGMVRAKSVLGMLMQNVTAIAVVSLVWAMVGFSLAFGNTNGFLGDVYFAGLRHLDQPLPGFETAAVPAAAFAAFHMMFAVLASALITGAAADRWRFSAFVIFTALWSVVVYAPVAHWLFSPTGWAARLGAVDFAGGTVVHVSAGGAALAMAIVLGRRHGWPTAAMPPHNLPLVMLGASLMWFGWLALTAGSAGNANGVAATALTNTQLAASAGLLTWIAVERMRVGKATTLGAASGAVSGLVAITPCAGYVSAPGAVAIGIIAGALCAMLVGLKTWLRIDDSSDVVAVHLGGGAIGSLCVGLFATSAVNPSGPDGLFYGGGYRQLGLQGIAVLAVVAYSFVATLILGSFLSRVMRQRVRQQEETIGLDLAQHGESAYALNGESHHRPQPVLVDSGAGAPLPRRIPSENRLPAGPAQLPQLPQFPGGRPS